MTRLCDTFDREGAPPAAGRIRRHAWCAAVLLLVLPVVLLAAPDLSLPLRFSRELSEPRPASALARELLRLERRTLRILNEGNDDAQAVSEKLSWLEADLAELKRAEARLAATAGAVAVPSTAGTGNPSAVAGALRFSMAPAPAGPWSTALEQISSASGVASRRWTAVTGLAALTLLLSWLFLRRRQGVSEGERVPRRRAVGAWPVVIESDPLPMAGGAAAAAIMAAPPESGLVGPAPALEVTANREQTFELAEIMLSCGRVSGAANTLEQYLAENPKASLPPWIRLLQIYQHHNMRDEFEALTWKLNQNFNVEIIRWNGRSSREGDESTPLDPAHEKAREKADSVEEMPWIRDRIVALWGKPECLVYLQKLLRDHRDGRRSGFTLPVVEELLFFIDLMVARQAAG